MSEVLRKRWRRRRALRALVGAVVDAWAIGGLDQHEPCTRLPICATCGLTWPCPVRRLFDAADAARKEL
jgi:hypothetical protein